MKKSLLFTLFSFGCFYQANAQEFDSTKVAPPTIESTTNYKPVRLLISGAFEFGGDEIFHWGTKQLQAPHPFDEDWLKRTQLRQTRLDELQVGTVRLQRLFGVKE